MPVAAAGGVEAEVAEVKCLVGKERENGSL